MDAPPIQYARTADGVNIAWWTLDEGPVLVFMTPPWGNHVEAQWQNTAQQEQYRRWAANCGLVGFDHRGAGLSTHGLTEYSIDGFADDLECVIRADGGHATVFAHSTSLGPAAICALRDPRLISRLDLWSPESHRRDASSRERAISLRAGGSDRLPKAIHRQKGAPPFPRVVRQIDQALARASAGGGPIDERLENGKDLL